MKSVQNHRISNLISDIVSETIIKNISKSFLKMKHLLF